MGDINSIIRGLESKRKELKDAENKKDLAKLTLKRAEDAIVDITRKTERHESDIRHLEDDLRRAEDKEKENQKKK
jgi:hypothetical protein